jgi:hypothetical protein
MRRKAKAPRWRFVMFAPAACATMGSMTMASPGAVGTQTGSSAAHSGRCARKPPMDSSPKPSSIAAASRRACPTSARFTP